MQPTIENGKVVTRVEQDFEAYVSAKRDEVASLQRHIAVSTERLDSVLAELQALIANK